MGLVQYLIAVGTRHGQAKDAHEEELQELWRKQKKGKRGHHKITLTYDDELELLEEVIGSVRGKPHCLKKLSMPAIGALAYILLGKVSADPIIEGHDIIEKLLIDPERTDIYLKSLDELKQQRLIRLIDNPGSSFTDEPPFSYLQSYIELGENFHKAMGNNKNISRSFTSNDTYLDAVFSYLQAIIRDDTELYRVTESETDLSTVEPHGWFRRIALRVKASTCELPAAETQSTYALSIYQHLTLAGLLGMRDGDISFDFSDPSEVTTLFAQGRVCRQRMKEHLFGKKSPLMVQQLLEGAHSEFGESVRLTQHGIKSLLGKLSGNVSTQDMRNRIKKNTLFDFEEPTVKKDSVHLPPPVMEAVRSIIFSESEQGQKLRKDWHVSLPAAWGSPTGSTVLLYGPPGTGKTLTAQYLASELKLPLLKIDAARVLSCWVGDSEKNVRRIFDDYANLQKELGVSPVLLLNEADQLLGSRDAGSNGVDRMNNNMLALFLEGLERFSGILVGTTNRRDLLDDAFSRRFTYKMELPPPDRSLRIELWKSHLPKQRLAEDVDIGILADLGLSGGEIRLVIERAVRLQAYQGIATIDGKVLTDIATEELRSRMKRNGTSGRIGFGQ